MTDIFISYATEDRPQAKRLAQALEQQGWSIWWDRRISIGSSFHKAIEEALAASRCVVVLWSPHAVASEWVINEADEARKRGILVPTRFGEVKIPLAFRHVQTADLTDWQPSSPHPEFDQLITSLTHKLGPPRPPVTRSAPTPAASSPIPLRPAAAAPTPATRRPWFTVMWATLAIFLLIAGAGLWYWDAYYREHLEYHANFIYRWGFPEGVGKLSQEQVRHRNASLVFIKTGRRGVAHEVRAVTSRGNCPLPFARSDFNNLGKANSPFGDLPTSICRIRFEPDANGRILNQSVYNHAGQRLYTAQYTHRDIHRAIIEYKQGDFKQATTESGITYFDLIQAETEPDAGLVKDILYLDRSGKSMPNASGDYGQRKTFNSQGQATETVILGRDGQPMANSLGIASVRFAYGAFGNNIRQVSLGTNGQPVLSAEGIAETRYSYDQYGNLKEAALLGTGGKLVTCKACGFSVRTFAYDQDGNVIETAFFDSNRQPLGSPLGFAKNIMAWDQEGRVTETYFGVDGKPILMTGGYVSLRIRHDERGYRNEFAYFDENDRPVRNGEGCALTRVANDEKGNRTESRCFDEGGHPIRTTDGAAITKWVYDDNGNTIEESYFGPDDQPGLLDEDYVKARFDYNPQGKKSEEAYFDKADKPVKNQDGYAKITYVYNPQGKITELRYFDESGRPVLRKGGYAKITRRYDARGNEIEEATFDVQDQAVRTENGYHKNKSSYDNRGYAIEEAYFDERDRPTLDKNGVPEIHQKHNAAGQVVKRGLFDLTGAFTTSKNLGHSRKIWDYNPRGQVSKVSFYDSRGHPIRISLGYATAKYIYDDLGRESRYEYFDIDGKPVLTKVTVYKVEPDGKARRVGLLEGDVILNYDGQEVADRVAFSKLNAVIFSQQRTLTLQRNGEVLTIDIPPGVLTGIEYADKAVP